MSIINIQKAQTGVRINIEKICPGLTQVEAVLSWKKSPMMSAPIDLDLSAIMLDENGKMLSETDLLFYNTPNGQIAEGALAHSGDELDGGSDEASVESINADLTKIPKPKVAFFISIDEKEGQTGLNLGQAVDAQITLVDKKSGQKIIEYDLTEDYSGFKFMRVFEIYQRNGTWTFNPQGIGSNEDLGDLIRSLGFQTNPPS